MERSPTLFDHFPGFSWSPLIYDGIRPGRQTKGIYTERCRAEESSSKSKVIPIKVEHIASNRILANDAVKNDGENCISASPIQEDDIVLQLIDSAKGEWDPINDPLPKRFLTRSTRLKSSKPATGSDITSTFQKRNLSNEELKKQRNEKQVTTIDLTATPKVLNEAVQARSMTAISEPKGSWTVIPIHHCNSPTDSQFKSSAPKKEPSVKALNVGNAQNDKTHDQESIQADNLELITPLASNDQSTSLARHDMEVEISEEDFHLPSSDILGRSDLHPAFRPELFNNLIDIDSLQKEQDVNPTPSYPIYGELKPKLQKENRKIDYIRGDGNCFFRAISKQLYGTEKYHKSIRSLVVDIMATNRSAFAQFIDGQEVQAHLDRMSEENMWATTCEIYAAATLLQREIYMLTPDHNNTKYSWLLFKPLFKNSSQSGGNKSAQGNDKWIEDTSSSSLSDHPCYLTFCNTNGNHYDRVVPDHGGCNCFLPSPYLDGHSGSVDLT